jgi:hypothetical protein
MSRGASGHGEETKPWTPSLRSARCAAAAAAARDKTRAEISAAAASWSRNAAGEAADARRAGVAAWDGRSGRVGGCGWPRRGVVAVGVGVTAALGFGGGWPDRDVSGALAKC